MIGDTIYDCLSHKLGNVTAHAYDSVNDEWSFSVTLSNGNLVVRKAKEMVNIDEAKRTTNKGYRCAALTSLYELPLRDLVNWLEFPIWARPNCDIEGGHE